MYAALNYSGNNFNIELGDRLNIHSAYGSYDVLNINPSYLINKQVKLFSNVYLRLQNTSLYQLFSEYGNRNLKPEAAFTYEGGLNIFLLIKNLPVVLLYLKEM